jgi:hypothetical protein
VDEKKKAYPAIKNYVAASKIGAKGFDNLISRTTEKPKIRIAGPGDVHMVALRRSHVPAMFDAEYEELPSIISAEALD